MNIAIRMTLISCLALFTTACQAQEGVESNAQRREREVAVALDNMGVTLGEPVKSLFNFTVNSFNAINETNLIVTAGVHDHYLITLATPCLNLRYAFRVALVSRTSTINTFDTIVVNSLHDMPERCSIDGIYRLNDKPE